MDIYEFDNSATYPIDPTFNGTVWQQSKYRFTKVYEFSGIHFRAYRIIFLDMVALWSKGAMKADVTVFLYNHLGDRLKKDFKLKLTEHLAQAKIPALHHRLDISYLEMKKVPSEMELEAMRAETILPLLFICLMPLGKQGTKDTTFEARVIELVKDEISYLLETIQPYLRNTETYLINYETVTREWFNALDEIDKTIRMMEWYVGEWYPVKPKTTEMLGYTKVLNSVYNSAPTGLNMFGLWTMWEVYAHKKYFHSSHLLRDKKQIMMAERRMATPASEFVAKLADPPVLKSNPSDAALQIKATVIKPSANKQSQKKGDATKKPPFYNFKRKAAGFNNIQIVTSDGELSENEMPGLVPKDIPDLLSSSDEESSDDEPDNKLNFITSSGQNSKTQQNQNGRHNDHKGKPKKHDNGAPKKRSGACDAKVLRDHCFDPDCPYDHSDEVVQAAQKKYLSKWDVSKTSMACIANMNLLRETFNDRQDIINSYQHFETEANRHHAEQSHPEQQPSTQGNDVQQDST